MPHVPDADHRFAVLGLLNGGLDLAVEEVYGATTAWHCEVDSDASRILAHRWPGVPNLGDITAADWSAVEPVDILAGGFPCQDLSGAGKRLGLRPGSRSGLWQHFAYAIDQLRPRLVVIENVRGLLSASAHSDVEPCPWCVGDGDDRPVLRALGAVLGDLAGLGYDARWHGLPASDVGAPHGRFRIFVTAEPAGDAPVLGRDHARSANRSDEPQGAARRSGVHAATDSDGSGLEGRGFSGSRAPRSGDASGRVAAADTTGNAGRLGHGGDVRARSGRGAASDAASDGRDEGRTEPARLVGRPHDAVRRCEPWCQVDRDWRVGDVDYGPAIRRWHDLTSCVPSPTETGSKGGQRLSPLLNEWMMGLTRGWVTDVPSLSRNAKLKALGNGVVPQQAVAAMLRLAR